MPHSLPAIWKRHPRYVILASLIILGTFYLLSPYDTPSFGRKSVLVSDPGLEGRLQRSNQVYEKTLKGRQDLIKKFGPTPDKVASFPPNKAPWPPYTVWDFFPASYNCPHEVERIGAFGDGGKWVCGLSRIEHKRGCVVYSVGINHESSFESDLLSRTADCQVWGYDFSVNSFGPEITASQKSRTHFFPYGLAGHDAHSSTDKEKMYTLDSLMRMNGHTYIDILKIDIESWEFETLTTLIQSYMAAGRPLPFGQLQLEIHIWNKKFSEFLTWWETLEEAGLRPFWTEPNLVYQNYNKKTGTADLAEYSFLNIKGKNIFIHDDPYAEDPPAPAH